MKKTTKLLFKPHYWKSVYTDKRRVWRKSKLYKLYKKYPAHSLYSIAIILAVLFLSIVRVYAQPEPVIEIGIPIPKYERLEPIKAPKTQKVQYAAVKVEKPSKPLIGAVSGDVWYKLRLCESGNDYRKNTGNGYYGAYQFSYSTWQSMGTNYERADLAPPAVQDDAAKRLQARSGWGQWPHCSSQLGLR